MASFILDSGVIFGLIPIILECYFIGKMTPDAFDDKESVKKKKNKLAEETSNKGAEIRFQILSGFNVAITPKE